MKTKAICSFFVLFAIVAGMITAPPAAFADAPDAPHNIEAVLDSGFGQDCVTDGCYTPSTLTVDVGHIIIMTNSDDPSVHTFTSGTIDGFTPTPSGVFDSDILMPGESFEYTADTVGEIPYYCMLHTWMVGTLVVQEVQAEEEMQMEEEVEVTLEEEISVEASSEEEMQMEETMEEEVMELMVTITDSAMGDGTHVDLEFSEIHVNYEITAMQNGETILQETAHAMEMIGENYHIDAVGSDESPIVIEVVSLPGEEGFWNGPTGTVATTQIVPEFGTIAMMVLAIAIISIVAITAKSRVIPRF